MRQNNFHKRSDIIWTDYRAYWFSIHGHGALPTFDHYNMIQKSDTQTQGQPQLQNLHFHSNKWTLLDTLSFTVPVNIKSRTSPWNSLTFSLEKKDPTLYPWINAKFHGRKYKKRREWPYQASQSPAYLCMTTFRRGVQFLFWSRIVATDVIQE